MRPSESAHVTGKLDKVAVVLSGVCLVHCLILPLLIALFPVFGFTFVDHSTFHQLILLFVIPTTVLALGMGYWRHRRHAVPVFGAVGVLALVIAAFVVHAMHAEGTERTLTVVGGLLIGIAHIQNFRATRDGHCPRHPVSTP